MKEKIFLLSRVPVEFLSPEEFEIIYWGSLFNGNYPVKKYLEKADSEPFPRNSSFLVRVILGFLSDFKGIVIFTTPGSHSEHRTILSILIKKGIKIVELHTGDNKKVEIEHIFKKMKDFSHIKKEKVVEQFNLLSSSRKKLYEGIKSGDLYGHNMHLSALNLASGKNKIIKSKDKKKLDKGKIILMGTPVTSSIISHIEKREYSVALTLQSISEIFLIGNSMEEVYSKFPFVSRNISYLADRVNEVIKDMEISGVIYLMVPLSHEYLEYELFKEKISLPIIPIEIAAPWKLDKRTGLRIDSFLEVLEKK